ncbi:hypothetical protein LAG90_00955 [Marinilongibacter aquaticus]|uniref:hypothetical protein n=1 Tax=Marinilongibacter aquaticus TaxID=2975157 RepID=UPI0021BD0F0D|nr:hypothetical protein [Marinilongibacter aquaticus]UBM59226.1 hypothetical protein LAG90_00955 [Marinilongibacter aquaticus]
MRHIYILLLALLAAVPLAAQSDSTKTDTTRTFGVLTPADQYKRYLPNYSPASPNQSGFARYGDNRANLATGLIQETIPIYTIKSGDLEVPISLSCHMGGHRMNDRASFVGWGWTLQSGGSVSRQVQGLPDDQGSGGYLQNPVIVGRNLCSSSADYTYAKQIRDNQRDGEPDVFSFSYPQGSGGRFLLGQSGADPLIIPWMPIRVDDIYNGSAIVGFRIVDERGREYVFGGDGAYEQTTEINSRWTKTYLSNFHLTDYLSANSDNAISWTYTSGGSYYQEEKQYSVSMIGSAAGNPSNHFVNSQAETVTPTNVSTGATFRVPAKITYKNGEVDFVYSTGTRSDLANAKYLKEIHIYTYEAGAKTLLRKVLLHHSYFKNASGQNARLKLDSLSFLDAGGQTVEKYRFGYHSDSFSWNDTDSYRVKQDFFGFYNGKNNQSLIVPSSYNTGNNNVSIVYGGANRSTVSTFLKEGVLRKVTYPTGGFTLYDFEPHQYYDGSSNVLAGGLRVKEIANHGADGALAGYRRYVYGNGGIGKLPTNWLPSSVSVPKINYLWWQDAQSGSSATAAQYHFSGSGAVEQGSFDSSPVYYTSVTEYFEESGSALSNGRIEYDFSHTYDQITTTPTFKQLSIRPWKRGNLLEKRTYDGNSVLTAKETHTYAGLNESTVTKAAFIGNQHIFTGSYTAVAECPSGIVGKSGGGPYEVTHTTYGYQTGADRISTSTFMTDNVNYTQTFSYDDRLMPYTVTTSYGYSNKVRSSVSVYPTHSGYATDPVAQNMVARNMVGIALEQTETESFGGSAATYFKRRNVYGLFAGNNSRGLSNNILPKETWLDMTGGGLEKRVEFTAYDTDGNPLEYWVDGVPSAMAYGYGNELLIGRAERSTRAELVTALSAAGVDETDFGTTLLSTAQQNSLAGVRNALGDTRSLNWYSHIPHVGISQTVAPNGLLQTHVYDSFQRLRKTQDHQGRILDLYRYQYADGSGAPQVPSSLSWDTGRNTCSNAGGGTCTFQVFVTGIGTGAGVEFSTDNSNWYAANIGADGYQVSVPYSSGGSQNFWARPSDNPVGGKIFGTLSLCPPSAGPPAAPAIAISTGTLCSVGLSASGCGGTVNWSNGATGSSISVPTITSTAYTATCTTAGGTSGSSNSITVPVLPAGWTAADVGAPSGSCTQESSGSWTLKSSGVVDAGQSDSFHYVYKQITGDFTLTVKLADITNTEGDRSGIMIRNSLDPKAIDFAIFQDGNAFAGLNWRTTQGGDNGFKGFVELVIDQTWLRVQRSGGDLYYYYSTDGGTTWYHNMNLSPAFPVSLSLNSSLYVGLATWGGLHAATFTNLQIDTP